MNMVVLPGSRKRRVAGEIFAYRMHSEPSTFRFGRVIRVDARIGPMEGINLVYFYRANSQSLLAVPLLSTAELLIPPEFINNLPWSKGYFQTVGMRDLLPEDVLPSHCFYSHSQNRFVDEFGKAVQASAAPTGIYALASYRTIDDRLSDALGIQRSTN